MASDTIEDLAHVWENTRICRSCACMNSLKFDSSGLLVCRKDILSPHRLVVRMSRRGRDNPGSTPGEDIISSMRWFILHNRDTWSSYSLWSFLWKEILPVSNCESLCVCLCVCVCINVCRCVWETVFASVCLHICVYTCVCVCMYTHVIVWLLYDTDWFNFAE